VSAHGPVLRVEGLTTALAGSGVPILDRITFDLEPGEVLGIVGESGSGKSMLALAIMGLLPSAVRRMAGRVVLDGEDLTALSASAWRARRGRDLAMIFQEPLTALNPVMTVGAQVAEVLTRRRGLDRSAARREVVRLFGRVEIPSAEARFAAYPYELSGGMRQRVVIAMALAAGPKLLVADEPTTALDVTIQAQILDLLSDLQQRLGMAILIITHDLGVIAEVADQVLVMYAGRIVESADVNDLFADPQHPYTIGLLGSIPRINVDRERLATIEGTVPSPNNQPAGCRFAPRCPFAQAICTTSPALVGGGTDNRHVSACRRDAEADSLRQAALDPSTWQRTSSFAMS
jgi:peptide/nickel transport system ATP-binding protein